MMYIVRFNGEKVQMFDNFMRARHFVKHHCVGGEIVAMSECENPKASRMFYNELFENREAYAVNPFVEGVMA